MNYSTREIGSRIKAERKALRLSQGELAEKCNLSASSRQTVGAWEQGNLIPSVPDLLRLCSLFDCELGYLLGEHEGRTRVSTDIHEKTGLSFRAIDELERMKKGNQYFALQGLNALIEEEGCNTLDLVGHYMLDSDTDTILPNGDKVPTKSIFMTAIQRGLDRIGRESP